MKPEVKSVVSWLKSRLRVNFITTTIIGMVMKRRRRASQKMKEMKMNLPPEIDKNEAPSCRSSDGARRYNNKAIEWNKNGYFIGIIRRNGGSKATWPFDCKGIETARRHD